MDHNYNQTQPMLTSVLGTMPIVQWDPLNQPAEAIQQYQEMDINHAAYTSSTQAPGRSIDEIVEQRRLSSMPMHFATPGSGIDMLAAAYIPVGGQAMEQANESHFGSFSTDSRSSYSAADSCNLEQNDVGNKAYTYGSVGGSEGFNYATARFYPIPNGDWQQQQDPQAQFAQPQHAQQPPAPQQQQQSLPPARADNRVPISRRHDSTTSNTSGPAHSRTNSHASPAGLDGQQPLPRSSQPPPPAAMGPMSVGVTIPPRPKPGRKPIEPEQAQDRRRIQNRMAQRNFRDKRQMKLQEAQNEIEEIKAEREAERAEMAREKEHFRLQLIQVNERAETERQQSNARIASLEQQLHALQQSLQQAQQEQQAQQHSSHSIGAFRPVTTSHSYPQSSVPTPPEDTYYETDFTNFGRNDSSGYGLRTTTTNNSDPIDTTMDEDMCGFCSDESNCVCLQAKLAERKQAAAPPPAAVTLPGNCDACRQDPARAQACRDMASSTRIATRAPLSQAPRPNLTSSMPPPDYSCSAMVDKFNQFGERHATIGNLFGRGQLTAYPRKNGGYEFEEKEAAEVLSTLSRRSTMVESPRTESDS